MSKAARVGYLINVQYWYAVDDWCHARIIRTDGRTNWKRSNENNLDLFSNQLLYMYLICTHSVKLFYVYVLLGIVKYICTLGFIQQILL